MDVRDEIILHGPDGTAVRLPLRQIHASPVRFENAQGNAVVSHENRFYLVMETSSDIRKEQTKIALMSPPEPKLVGQEAAKYGLVLLKMEGWMAEVSFDYRNGLIETVDLKDTDIEDLMGKAHMNLTLRYKESHKQIPTVKINPFGDDCVDCNGKRRAHYRA